jgi:MFS family permease
MNLSPLLKGTITAVAMITVALVTYYSGLPPESPFQYLVYALYALGITWTLIAYKTSPAFTGKFSDSFNQGFRCFIVVTLLMVAFTFIFTKMHPEFANESSQLYREQLIKEKGLPDEIETKVAQYQKGYSTALLFGAIFSYLVIGAAVTAVTALLIRKK